MIDCKTCLNDLDAYRDGALEKKQHSDIGAHLEQCADCRAARQRADDFDRQLREVASTWVPPDGLWARIKQTAAMQQEATGSHTTRPLLPAVAAAILLFSFAFVTLLHMGTDQAAQSESTAAALVNEFHTFVISRRELDYSEARPDNLRDWFSNKVEFRVPLPVTAAEYRLAGGRLCSMLEQRIVSFMYRVDGAWVSLYIMKSMPQDVPRQTDRELLVNGYGFIGWQHQGLRYSLVGDLPAERLRGIANHLYPADGMAAEFGGDRKLNKLSQPNSFRI